MKRQFPISKLAAATAAISLLQVSGYAISAEPGSRIVLEEIVVTA